MQQTEKRSKSKKMMVRCLHQPHTRRNLGSFNHSLHPQANLYYEGEVKALGRELQDATQNAAYMENVQIGLPPGTS